MTQYPQPDFFVGLYNNYPCSRTTEISDGSNRLKIDTPEQAHRFEPLSTVLRMAEHQRELENPLRLLLCAKMPVHIAERSFHVRRVIDLEASTDLVSVRFYNKEGVPVQLNTPTEGFPSDALIGQLTLLLS